LFTGHQGQRIEAAAGPTGKNNSFFNSGHKKPPSKIFDDRDKGDKGDKQDRSKPTFALSFCIPFIPVK